MKSLPTLLVLLFSAVALSAQPAQVSTLTLSRLSSTYVFQDVYTDQGRGFLFTTDNASYTLDSIQVSMMRLLSGPLTGYLTAWDGLTPSYTTPIAFTHSGVGTSFFNTVTFTPTTSFTLDPEATYAFKLVADTPGYFEWGYVDHAADFTTPAGNTWLMSTGAITSTDGGASWSPVAAGVLRLQAAVLATSTSAIPEPSTYALIAGLMMAGVAVLRRRRAG